MQKAGWKVYHVPDAKVTHLGGESKRRAPWQSQIEYCRSLYIFLKKQIHSVVYHVQDILPGKDHFEPNSKRDRQFIRFISKS